MDSPAHTDIVARETKLIRRAVWKSDLETLNILLNSHPDYVNLEGQSGETPLHWAAYFGDQWIVSLLVSKGADPDAMAGTGMAPIHMAATRDIEGVEVVRVLVEKGADIDLPVADSGFTALHLAVRAERAETVLALIELGANVNAWDCQGRTPRKIANVNGFNDIEATLKENGGRLE